MAGLSKAKLLTRVTDATLEAGHQVLGVAGNHPWDIEIDGPDGPLSARLYIWNVSHGGGAKRPEDEYRIQVNNVDQPLQAPSGAVLLVLGWDDERGVFAAFDPRYHREFQSLPSSIQIPLETLERAAADGFAGHRRLNGELEFALKPRLLVTYARSQAELHQFAGTSEEIELLEHATDPVHEEQDLEELPYERQRVVRSINRLVRAWDFRQRVLAAYGGSCALCGSQLGLVEAAHIVPVGCPDSTDETSNGIALCPLHHRAYDGGLLSLSTNRTVVVHDDRLDALTTAGLGSGSQALGALEGSPLTQPLDAHDCPSDAVLETALAFRAL